jgi:hypothetical protein
MPGVAAFSREVVVLELALKVLDHAPCLGVRRGPPLLAPLARPGRPIGGDRARRPPPLGRVEEDTQHGEPLVHVLVVYLPMQV